MVLRTGIDLIEIERVAGVIERQGERFLERVFTMAEREVCQGNLASLAARWAAKEAAAKALGTGIGPMNFTDIEVLRDAAGAPTLQLHGPAQHLAISLGLQTWSVSLTHTEIYAAAVVVAAG